MIFLGREDARGKTLLMMSNATQQQIHEALRRNAMHQAMTLAQSALSNGESHETLYCLAALGRQQAGDNHGAATLYLQAAELAPGNPAILAGAADALRCAGRLREAIRLFDEALALEPSSLAAWYGRAMALDAESSLDEALASFERVTILAPNSAAGFAGLSGVQSRMGTIAAARRSAEQAFALGPEERGTFLAMARVAFASGEYAQAAGWAEKMLASPDLSADDEIIAATLLGDCHDKSDKPDKAYQAYERANRRFSVLHEGPDPEPVVRYKVEAIATALKGLDGGRFSGRAGSVPPEARGHVFLLGYPRSGTTLTEHILSTLPDFVSLEEAPTLAHLSEYIEADGLEKLPLLDDRKMDVLRAEYWANVAALGADVAGKVFIDMDPLKGAALPVIAALFPQAKVIVMHRDPRDIVWSCFRHSFLYSPATCEFTSLERTARHFDAVMTVIRLSLDRLKPDAHIVRYEHLVRHFDEATRELCAFLGVAWSADMRAFDHMARQRKVRTASADQVRQSLFDGSGQWTKYAEFIDPVISHLAEWIDPMALKKPVSIPIE